MEICGGPTWTLNAMMFSLRGADGRARPRNAPRSAADPAAIECSRLQYRGHDLLDIRGYHHSRNKAKHHETGDRERNGGTTTALGPLRACLARNPAAAYRDSVRPSGE